MTTNDPASSSSAETLVIAPRHSILIGGTHAEAGVPVRVPEAIARDLILAGRAHETSEPVPEPDASEDSAAEEPQPKPKKPAKAPPKAAAAPAASE